MISRRGVCGGLTVAMLGLCALGLCSQAMAPGKASDILLKQATLVVDMPSTKQYEWQSDDSVYIWDDSEPGFQKAFRYNIVSQQSTDLTAFNQSDDGAGHGGFQFSSDGQHLFWFKNQHHSTTWCIADLNGKVLEEGRYLIPPIPGYAEGSHSDRWYPNGKEWVGFYPYSLVIQQGERGRIGFAHYWLGSPTMERFVDITCSDAFNHDLPYGRNSMEMPGLTADGKALIVLHSEAVGMHNWNKGYIAEIDIDKAIDAGKDEADMDKDDILIHEWPVPIPPDSSVSQLELSPTRDRWAWLVHRKHGPDGSPAVEIWVSRLDGTGMHRIGSQPIPSSEYIVWVDGPWDIRWLPSGKRLSFEDHYKLYTVPVH